MKAIQTYEECNCEVQVKLDGRMVGEKRLVKLAKENGGKLHFSGACMGCRTKKVEAHIDSMTPEQMRAALKEVSAYRWAREAIGVTLPHNTVKVG